LFPRFNPLPGWLQQALHFTPSGDPDRGKRAAPRAVMGIDLQKIPTGL
jgi:hypothetical protein